MCRLLATVAPSPLTGAQILGKDRYRVFQDLARLHRDGWGTAWLGEHGLEVFREVSSGFEDARLTDALRNDPSRARITHLRLATEGMACNPGNTHPFLADGMAFAHNGALVPLEGLADLIAPEIAASLIGTTDSERYFAVLRSALLGGQPFEESLRAAAGELRARFPRSSMNAMLLTPTHLAVIHASRAARVPYEDFVEATANGTLPEGHNEHYYRMHVRERADGSLAFASTGMDVASWDELPPESITVVELATMRRRTLSLSGPGSRAAGVTAA